MNINEAKKSTISFEFFPPKTEKGLKPFESVTAELAALQPDFMTITYGAGGSTRDKTLSIAADMVERTGIPIAAHLTFIGTPKDELRLITDELWNSGVRHLIALRGDMPEDLNWPLDTDAEYFQYTSDFVEGLKEWHDFEISVGAYPEKHPDAPSLDADIAALKLKCEAGSDRAITQYFFDNEIYYKFVEQCRAAGIQTPITPGLLPIHDFKSMVSFSKRCQTQVPSWLFEKFEGLEDKPETALKLAEELLVEQVLDLARNGVEHFHFYTLNKTGIITQACKALGRG